MACTHGPVSNWKEVHERSHHRSAEAFRHSLHDGVTVYSELSPVTGFFATVAAFDAEASQSA
jgi:hypothetical protein